jgi:hypothetical protein
MTEGTSAPLDLDRLLRLRLVVARHGEMDMAEWWNTKGMLGRYGEMALERGFPRTHFFAQAKVVFAVARARCREIYDPPNAVTLWDLPAEIEDQFEARWHDWLDDLETWSPFFEALKQPPDDDLLESLQRMDLLLPLHSEAVGKLRRSAEGRAVLIADHHEPTDEAVTLLAAGFSRGDKGALAVPYLRLEV